MLRLKLNSLRIFIVEFLAICLIVFVSEMFFDIFKNNNTIDKAQFLSTLYRAIRLAFVIRLTLTGLELFNKYLKTKK